MSWPRLSRARRRASQSGWYPGRALRPLLLLALPLLLLGACGRPQSPEITRLANFGIGQDAQGDWVVNLDVQTKNPNRQAVRIVRSAFDVWLDSTPLATIRLKEKVKLPGRSDTTVRIPLVISFRSKSDELRLLFGALARGGVPNIELEGDVKVRLGIYSYKRHLGRQGLGELFRQLGLPPPKGFF
ncbi:MAG: hypothetical protein CSA07_03350 [Bacteroidia bacterium]|nr:MAG: hypothetical protein CSA07_03350 [Bacteroidia bacterium]